MFLGRSTVPSVATLHPIARKSTQGSGSMFKRASSAIFGIVAATIAVGSIAAGSTSCCRRKKTGTKATGTAGTGIMVTGTTVAGTTQTTTGSGQAIGLVAGNFVFGAILAQPRYYAPGYAQRPPYPQRHLRVLRSVTLPIDGHWHRMTGLSWAAHSGRRKSACRAEHKSRADQMAPVCARWPNLHAGGVQASDMRRSGARPALRRSFAEF